MTNTSSDKLPDETLISMKLDPELMFFTWKVGVENYVANKATIVEPTGLLSAILADAEWQACALNRSHSPGGLTHCCSKAVTTASCSYQRG